MIAKLFAVEAWDAFSAVLGGTSLLFPNCTEVSDKTCVTERHTTNAHGERDIETEGILDPRPAVSQLDHT